MKNISYKSFFTEIKADLEENMFEGYASYFGNKDSYDDIVEAGAFKKTIKENQKRIKVLWQHDIGEPIGKPMHMEEDSKGLYIKAKIAETDTGKKAMTLLRDGIINEMSIGYSLIKDEWDRNEEARMLKEIKLWEVSLVSFAANDKAQVTGVKHEQFENLLTELREGKFIIDKDKIQVAIKALTALLEQNEPSKDTRTVEKSQYINDIDPLHLQSILQEIEKYK